MWLNGIITVDGIDYEYWVKVYDTPSETFGINGGKISKLSLRKDGVEVVNYDRGWDKRPKTTTDKKAYKQILKEKN